MSGGISLHSNNPAMNATAFINTDSLMAELANCRRKAEWLAVINELHVRLAGATDLASMIEAFSVWLMPLLEHDLIAYNNPTRKRTHMFCSCHGPKRQRIMEIAATLFRNDNEEGDTGKWRRLGDYDVREWRLRARDRSSVVLLRQKDVHTVRNSELIDEALQILRGPLSRVLDYEDLFEQARRDSLTGLANRRVFEERIDPLLDTAGRHGYPITLASMDLDKFKKINDTLGHAEGDRVLQRVAATLHSMIRGSDLLVRMGGDEFLLVLPDTDLQAAGRLAGRLCEAVEQLRVVIPGGDQLGISIGLTQWQEGMQKEEWLQKADEALYRAKASGGNRSQVVVAHLEKFSTPFTLVDRSRNMLTKAS